MFIIIKFIVNNRNIYRINPNQTNLNVQVTKEEFDALKSSGKSIEQVVLYGWTDNALEIYSSINNGKNPKITLLQNTRTPRLPFLFELGSMASISPEQFILDGNSYYQKVGDGYGGITQRLVSGIREYETIKYVQTDGAPTGIVKYLLPFVQSAPLVKPVSAAR